MKLAAKHLIRLYFKDDFKFYSFTQIDRLTRQKRPLKQNRPHLFGEVYFFDCFKILSQFS